MQSQVVFLVLCLLLATASAFVPMAVRNAKLNALAMSKAAAEKKAEKEKRKLLQAGPGDAKVAPKTPPKK